MNETNSDFRVSPFPLRVFVTGSGTDNFEPFRSMVTSCFRIRGASRSASTFRSATVNEAISCFQWLNIWSSGMYITFSVTFESFINKFMSLSLSVRLA